MAVFTTFLTTPTVMAIYRPARGGAAPRLHRRLQPDDTSGDDIRILSCVHGPGNAPSIINLVESIRSANKKSLLKLYIMRLAELSERSSAIMMVQRARKNDLPFLNRFRRDDLHDRAAIAFRAYGKLSRVAVRSTTAISALATMHEDICDVAEEKRVRMIVLPFHKVWRWEGDERQVVVENMGHGWRTVNQRVLENAPCSVAVLLDRGFGGEEQRMMPGKTVLAAQTVCVLFFGGLDDREALEMGGRMAEHPVVKVTVIRFVERSNMDGNGVELRSSWSSSGDGRYCFSTATMDRQKELEMDESAVTEFRRRFDNGLVEFKEMVASSVVEEVLKVGRSGDYELVVVGKGRFPSTPMVAGLADRQPEHAELGPIGDVLASGHGILSSVLVIQTTQFHTHG